MPKVAKPKPRVQRPRPNKTYQGPTGDPEIIPARWRVQMYPGDMGNCGKCGEAVAMHFVSKAGKNYPTELFMQRGNFFSGRLEFHSKYCGKPDLHMEFQIRYGEEAEEGSEG